MARQDRPHAGLQVAVDDDDARCHVAPPRPRARASCAGAPRDLVSSAEVVEDAVDECGLRNEADHAHLAAAAGTHEGVDLVDAADQLCPAAPEGGAVRSVGYRSSSGASSAEEGSAGAAAFLRLPREALE